MRRWKIACLIAALPTACAPGVYDQGGCGKPPSNWREPGELNHHEMAVFVNLHEDGAISTDALLPSGKTNGDKITRQDLSKVLKDIPTWAPEPLVILQPHEDAKCDLVRSVRLEMEKNLNCTTGKCGEGVGWRLFGLGELVG